MRLFFTLLLSILFINPVFSAVLEAGVSVNEIPDDFFGSWRVNATLENTNSHSTFKPKSMDFWNLSRKTDRVILDNPFSGANAEISIHTIEGNLVVFSKRVPYDNNKVLTDTVTLRLGENEFIGVNTLSLESYSLVDNHLMKTETAVYKIKGEKIAGNSVLKRDK